VESAPIDALASLQNSRHSLLAADVNFGRQPYHQASSYDGTAENGYHYREGIMTPSKASGSRGCLDFISTRWSRTFFLTIALQALLCLIFEM
jgi:hypothetical protein